jgi:L-alanine-DL-glutamate epimerase-like enolase superfamily enzyme
MHATRRRFLAAVGMGAAGAGFGARRGGARVEDANPADWAILRVDRLERPVIVREVQLLRNGGEYLVRVRSRDGGEGLVAANSMHMKYLYPIFLGRVAPFWVGKDACELEPLLWELYRHEDNYKYQGLALWVCVAAIEFALLDLLGRSAGVSVADLLGGARRRDLDVYRASGTRGNTPEEEVADLKRIVAESGARALKFRLGGRMSRNADSLPGRSEALIPMVREAFGPEMTLYADANSSYDPEQAIRVGRLMEEHDYAFFEEPCRFDHWEQTKQVADALRIPVAGGEQESSDDRFRWAVANRAVDVVQPDLHYYGGFLRSLRVAHAAHAAGLKCTPHMSGSGLGYLDAAYFAALLPNATPFTEFKGESAIPVSSPDSSLKPEAGRVRLPAGPGFGYTIDPAYVREAKVVKAE